MIDEFFRVRRIFNPRDRSIRETVKPIIEVSSPLAVILLPVAHAEMCASNRVTHPGKVLPLLKLPGTTDETRKSVTRALLENPLHIFEKVSDETMHRRTTFGWSTLGLSTPDQNAMLVISAIQNDGSRKRSFDPVERRRMNIFDMSAQSLEVIEGRVGRELDGCLLCSAAPVAEHRNGAGMLHRDGGRAIEYSDGWGVFCLNGAVVPEWLAMTPGEKLDVRKCLAEPNVQVRREAVRKIGIERVITKLGTAVKTIHAEPPVYELIEIDLKLRRTTRALKMMNPSVPECWHVEFVHPSCDTVQKALNFRNGLTPSMIDDELGLDWYQQGGVLLFPVLPGIPRERTLYRSRPKELT